MSLKFVSVPIVKPSLYIYIISLLIMTPYTNVYVKKESQNSKSSDKFIFRF